MAMRTPPPFPPTPNELQLLDWLRETERRQSIPPGSLVPALLVTLQTISSGRGNKNLLARLAELGTMGSPQRQTGLRVMQIVIALAVVALACCIFTYGAGALIVIANHHVATPTVPVPLTPTVPR
ncbi:MAG: hypothetical protein H0X24_00550 [Ktedonobacterales bacterium]|nr:hypothetical protein [Ktedonobacterales bacterium]